MLKVLQNFNKVLQALLAVFIEVLDQALFLDDLGHVLAEGELSAGVLSESDIAFDDMLEKTLRWLLHDLGDHHVVQYGAYS